MNDLERQILYYIPYTVVAVVAATRKGLYMRIQAPQPSQYLSVFRSERWQKIEILSLPLLLPSQSAMEVSTHFPILGSTLKYHYHLREHSIITSEGFAQFHPQPELAKSAHAHISAKSPSNISPNST